jgi:putative oxidoreductase
MLKNLVLPARILFAAIFVFAGFTHFSSQTIAYAASAGVPLANLAVPLSGVMAIVGGLSVATGYQTKWGALLLVAFLVPVTLKLHAFWDVTDPMMRQLAMAMFMKNVALIGSALSFAYFGAGPYSLDARRESRGKLAHAVA